MVLLGVVYRLNAPPKQTRRFSHSTGKETSAAYGKVEARCEQRVIILIISIIQHIDTTAKCQLPVHHAQFLMQAPLALG